jgi:putative ABC transport system permease protein
VSALLGWRLTARDPWRSLLAMGAIGAAVLIAFVEMGFLNGVVDSQLRIVRAVRGDLIVLDARREHLNRWDSMAPIRVPQLAALDGVAAVRAVYQMGAGFRGAADETEHRIIVLGFDAHDPPLELGWTAETLAALRRPDSVLYDRLSRPIYGTLAAGQEVWVESAHLTLAGFVSLGPTVVNDGHVVMGEAAYRRLQPRAEAKMVVLRLAPGADAERVKAEVRARIGEQVEVFTKEELSAREARFLTRAAPLGLLFGAGMTAGLLVALVFCYQALYVAIRRRLKAIATLKAMGFRNRFVLGTVLAQASLIGAGGYAIGLALAALAYRVLEEKTALAMELTGDRAGLVALACLAACIGAGALAAAKAMRTAPAELYG